MTRKLLIAIPSYETMRVEFSRSLMALETRLNELKVWYEVKIIDGTLVHIARDRLATHAVNNEFTEVLWIDSDMVFSPEIYEDLSEHGKDFVCGNFISRHHPYVSCIFSKLLPPERIYDFGAGDLMRVAGCGFGCVWMKAQVLRDVLMNENGQAFIPDPKLGEDLAFCMRAKKAGYEIWCDPTARVGHVASVVIWPEDGQRMRGEIQGLDGKTIN
jgi:hypothetical protein